MYSIDWTRAASRSCICPICERNGEFEIVASLNGEFSHIVEKTIFVAKCENCKIYFCDRLESVEYSNIDQKGLRFYLEAGAGIDSILSPLNLLDRRPVGRLLDIGCSFGYCLDYCQHILGWEVSGYDPGAIARHGHEILNVPIRNHYFGQGDLGSNRFDLILFSEVLEHIAEPNAFFRLLDQAITPDGVILMTTPNADFLTPDSPGSVLYPIFSPGHHIVFYTKNGLEKLFRSHGFAHVRMHDNGAQIQLAASKVPFSGEADYFNRSDYIAYLTQRSYRTPNSAASLGFAYRLLKEHVNSSQFEMGLGIYTNIQSDIRSQFGIDIDELSNVPIPKGLKSYEDFGAKFPFCLGSIWYFRGVIESLHFSNYAKSASYFAASFDTITELRRLLLQDGIEDGELADLNWAAEKGRIESLIAFSQKDAVRRIIEINNDDRVNVDQERRNSLRRLRQSLFTTLVNSNELQDADTLWNLDPDLATGDQLDPALLVSVGMYFLLSRANYPESEFRFRLAIDALDAGGESELLFQALSGLITAVFNVDPDRAVQVLSEIQSKCQGAWQNFAPPNQILLTQFLLRDLVHSGRADLVIENNELFELAIAEIAASNDPMVLLAGASILVRERRLYAEADFVIDRIYRQYRGNRRYREILFALEFEMVRPLASIDPTRAIAVFQRLELNILDPDERPDASQRLERTRIELFVDFVNRGDHIRASLLMGPIESWIESCRLNRQVDLLFTTGIHLFKHSAQPRLAVNMLDLAYQESLKDEGDSLLSAKIALAITTVQKTYDTAKSIEDFISYLGHSLGTADEAVLAECIDLFQSAIAAGDYGHAASLLELSQAAALFVRKSEVMPGLAFALGLFHLNCTKEFARAIDFLGSSKSQSAGKRELAPLHLAATIALLTAIVQQDTDLAIQWFVQAFDNKSPDNILLNDKTIHLIRENLVAMLIVQGKYLDVFMLTRDLEISSDERFLASNATNLFSKGIFQLNYLQDFKNAAFSFNAASILSSGPDGSDGFYWTALFHEGIALKQLGESSRALQIAGEMALKCEKSPAIRDLYFARLAELT